MSLQVIEAERKVQRAERRVVSAARAWFATFNVIRPDLPVVVADRQRKTARFILACGLDEEARNDLRAARRRRKP
jgi:hypothetical protein